MLRLIVFLYILPSVLRLVSSAPSSRYFENSTSFANLLANSVFERDLDDESNDHSDIVRMAAIGDSYSAGIGAGNRLGSISDIKCKTHANPSFVANNDRRT
jgi:hypothetical protein